MNRRLGLIAAGAAGLGVLALAWGMLGPSPRLSHAEFHHPSIDLAPGQPTVHVYFATNRKPGTSGPDGSFLAEGLETLSYGQADVRVPDRRRKGEGIPYGNVSRVNLLEEASFFPALAGAAHGRPGRAVIVWVHGYGLSFPGSLVQTARLAVDLNLDAVYVDFSWPSRGSVFGYEADRTAAESAGAGLAEFLRQLRVRLPGVRISVMAHSLGARTVCHAFSELGRDATWADADRELSEVILLAPNVDQGDFDERFRRQILAMADRLTVYVASNDRLLLLAKSRFGDKPLALTVDENSNRDEAQALLDWGQTDFPFDLVDASYVRQPDFTRHRYQRSPSVLSDLRSVLRNQPAAERNLLRSTLPYRTNAWILPAD